MLTFLADNGLNATEYPIRELRRGSIKTVKKG